MSILKLEIPGKLFYPLLGRARYRGRCWAAIRLSHHPEPSGRAVHREVNGLDIGGERGRRLVDSHTQPHTEHFHLAMCLHGSLICYVRYVLKD